MSTPTLTVTPLHVERGRQMRAIVLDDVATLGLSFEMAVSSLAVYLDISEEAVKLAIAIAENADGGGDLLDAA